MSGSVDFLMPSLGADMDEGTVTEWLVGAGDRVRRGQIVAIVETDKADIDIEVWQSGVVAEILVDPGRAVPVGTPLARLEVGDTERGRAPAAPSAAAAPTPRPSAAAAPTPGPSAAPAAAPARSAAAPPAPTPSTAPAPAPSAAPRSGPAPSPAPPQPVPSPAGVGAGRPPGPDRPASPLARRLAGERGIELATLTGSGPDGAVVARDLDGVPAAPTGETRPSPEERRRRVIADLMARSKREIPHYYLATELDLEPALHWLEATNAARPVEDRLLPAALLMRAVALALAKHPEFNGFWVDGRFVPGDGVHLGVAVSLRGGGLVAPAIRDADRLGVDELMARLRDLVTRARGGRLRGSEMTDATVTVTNLGDRGVEVVYGVIYPPQVAVVGLGRITTRPAVDGDEIVAHRQVTATLSADHRASDGLRGARFLDTLARLVRRPEELAGTGATPTGKEPQP